MSYKYKDADGTIHDISNNYNFEDPAGEIYSTTETVVGTWNDKPLYRKVINFTLPSSASTLNVSHGATNIDEVVNLQGIFKNSAGNAYNPIPQFIASSSGALTNYVRMYAGSLTQITIEMLGTTYASRKGYIIMEYTKTTD